MAQEKTPGVYINELDAFPNSVVEVPTAVPAFVGYTQKALNRKTPLTGVPTRITSLSEYEALFGGAPVRSFARKVSDTGAVFTQTGQTFYLYNALRIFFDNGGGPCWIVSVGGYDAQAFSSDDFSGAWDALAKEGEPTMYLAPDAVALPFDDYKNISETMMAQCSSLASRISILDVFDGTGPDVDAAMYDRETGFRQTLDLENNPSYGVAYYPWLNTNLTGPADVTFVYLDDDSRAALAADITAEQTRINAGSAIAPAMAALIARLTTAPTTEDPVQKTHVSLSAISPLYVKTMQGLLTAMNVLPPSGAMAGVMTRIDNEIGVFKAPANTGLMSVISPCVTIPNEQQEDLNMPLDGKAVNAIRTFLGRGVLVWGARTLDGNSQDFRYINVRRTLIMLEQSIYHATQAYVFAANDAVTWQTVKSMLENFLNDQWKAGALAGTKPADAYDVSVGLGSTMTGNDILDGYMRVTVRVAIVRPAEFIVITFQQKMPTS